MSTAKHTTPAPCVDLSSLPRVSGIYKITCTGNGRVYIGSAKEIRHRIRKHYETARRGKHHSPLFQRSFGKYGEPAFVPVVVELCGLDELIRREQYWIDFYRAADRRLGLNIHPRAASSLGHKLSAEQRRQISERQRGRKRHFTSEWCRNISLACMGRKASEYQRRRVSELNTGRPQSEETRRRRSATMTGQRKTAEHVAKLRQNQGGENHPRARFTWAQVFEIRELCQTERTIDVARRFGVAGYVISQIKHGHTWKTPPPDRL